MTTVQSINNVGNMDEEKSSVSAFLWKAAESATSVIESHPTIVANLMLRCKKALNDTKVGVRFRKVSRSNICQSCGYPWSAGNYKLKMKKTFKATKIKKILKRSKNEKKMSEFNKHILERYTNCQSAMVITCGNCSKQTAFPTPLPPRVAKQGTTVPASTVKKQEKNRKKNKKGNPPVEQISNKPSKKQEKKQTIQNKKQLSKVTKQPAGKQKFSKLQLKNISKSLVKNTPGKNSSLQSFLNSVK